MVCSWWNWKRSSDHRRKNKPKEWSVVGGTRGVPLNHRGKNKPKEWFLVVGPDAANKSKEQASDKKQANTSRTPIQPGAWGKLKATCRSSLRPFPSLYCPQAVRRTKESDQSALIAPPHPPHPHNAGWHCASSQGQASAVTKPSDRAASN